MDPSNEDISLDGYLRWIISNYGLERYSRLSRILFGIPFRSMVSMDVNRASDGIYMREDYIDHHPGSEYEVSCHLDGECSVLEFLTSFAARVDEATSYRKTRIQWVSYFIRNMGLIEFDDRFFGDNPERDDELECAVDERVARTLDRRYNYDGSNGGLFVLRKPPCDLRTVEYWWQMQYYVLERHMPRD